MESYNSTYKLMMHHENNGIQKYPVLFEVILTNKCNMDCPFCFEKVRDNTTIHASKLIEFLENSPVNGINITGGGEPTCHPKFDTISYALRAQGKSLGLFTNGHFPDARLKAINDCYNWVRYGFETDKQPKTKTKNTIQKMATSNEDLRHFIEIDCAGYYIKPNVNSNMFNLDTPMLLYKLQQNGNIVSWDKWHDIISGNFFNYNSCKSHYVWCAIGADGSFKVCPYRFDDDTIMGNIYDQTFEEIWNSDKRQKVIENLTDCRFDKCQRLCKGHTQNKMFNFFDHGSDICHP